VVRRAYAMKAMKDPLVDFLQKVIRLAVRILAVLMTVIILWGVGDVVYMFYTKLNEEPYYILNISDILATFGAFLAVLIAIEIFVTITMYLREGEDVDYVRLVLATALMASARKVIVFDYKEIESSYVFGTGLVILALSIAYFLIEIFPRRRTRSES
jgi:uncharacterized membrane protein (DUF373 family)